jgi:CRISPR-associated protein Cas5t
MIALYIEAPYGEFRKSYARSYAETYEVPPPATIYGMLLSAVGERFRKAHSGVRLGFAYRRRPRVATTLRKVSRYKYGVASKQSELGNTLEFIESLCNIEMICWVNSEGEHAEMTLERRLIDAIQFPGRINRYGVVSLGLSDDMINEISLVELEDGMFRKVGEADGHSGDDEGPWTKWHRLIPDSSGELELPIWVDHLGSADTRRQRFRLDSEPVDIVSGPGDAEWPWLIIE